MTTHNINVQDVIDAVQRDDNTGFCFACGEETMAGECEPDARNYECENCGEEQVFGAEECLLKLVP